LRVSHPCRAAALAAFALLLAAGCGKPAQIGSDDEVHKTVDALFTAVTARDATQLDRCEKRLAELKADGRLPASAHESLAAIVGRARSGKWESAAERLYEFIRGQETGPDHRPEKPKPKGGAPKAVHR
jgi:hypothetical protein